MKQATSGRKMYAAASSSSYANINPESVRKFFASDTVYLVELSIIVTLFNVGLKS